ncbi:LacI family transcriptional regulator [Aureimonas altamirensis]|uniref:LacI family DNA-binding transcriptional regulator n=1 Tax=Aureimonas altamirensis TaxID=370622 RepID=UPI0020372E9E|nr:LacI family DNA-binding transcriptional regulator [Aureimonas altamirensis]MCM2502714.1 LacI family transcriptional regulator [Aureimonas altamirensis]
MAEDGRKKRVTLGEVAKAAGLSPAAVSRYLSGQLSLPETTSRRIQKAIRELGYRPNHHARSLSLGRSDAIGLVVPDINNPFFSNLAAAVERAAQARGMLMMLCATSNRLERELEYLHLLGAGVVDALVFATNHGDPDGQLAGMLNGDRRVVLLDEDVPGTDLFKVFSDNRQGGLLAGLHLIEHGHRRIAYIGGPCDLMSARERAEGLHDAVHEAGGDAAIVSELFGSYTIAHGEAAMEEILDTMPGVSAVFSASDEILIGMLHVLRRRDRVVGRDISIVTFDDAGPLEILAVPVTAIRQPLQAMGERALDMAMDSLAGTRGPSVARLPVELIRRHSVARLA